MREDVASDVILSLTYVSGCDHLEKRNFKKRCRFSFDPYSSMPGSHSCELGLDRGRFFGSGSRFLRLPCFS